MYIFIKRLFDFAAAFILILILLPILSITSILILIFMGKPVIFTHKRIGMNETPFSIYKFRTLRNNDGQIKLTDNERLTRLGSFLRKFSIDEFPQLINILLGHMSFIGPRPLLARYLPYYTKREKTRHKVRPGMSGLAQVSGRSFLTWDEQFELDAIYVERISFILDLTVFLKTTYMVLASKNMMVTGRIDNECFDIQRKKEQLKQTNNMFDIRLESERLILRKLSLKDADDMFEYTKDSEVTKFLSWDAHTSINQTTDFIKNTIKEYDGIRSYPYAIEIKGERKFIGIVRAYDIDSHNKRCEISYILNPAFQGNGYMVEAINLFANHCFNQIGFLRIQAKCMIANNNSEKLMQRLGMEYEGILRNYWVYKGTVQDAKLYAIINYTN